MPHVHVEYEASEEVEVSLLSLEIIAGGLRVMRARLKRWLKKLYGLFDSVG